jgi:hypothetical protein
MATTTNYGWTTPDDTALVKDGAAAIRTLGSSVDTTTKALNPSTTLGDIEYRSSTSNVNTRLGIGSAGQVLTVASGVPSWATTAAGGMTLLSTTTLSGASVTISSIDQTYKNLFILFNNPFHTTASRKFIIKPNGTASIADFTFNSYTNGTTVSNGGVLSTDLNTNVNIDTTTNATTNVSALTICNYTDAVFGKPFHWYGRQSTNSYLWQFAGVFKTASAISSLDIGTDGSGTFSGGTVLVYGVK